MFILTILVMFPITPPIDQLHEASTPTFATIFTPIFPFSFPLALLSWLIGLEDKIHGRHHKFIFL